MAILERAELDQAARLAGLALPDAARAADLLVRAGVLDEAPLGFAHPLLRGAVYRDIAAVDRSEAHGRAAMLLAEAHASPAGVAEHLLATAPASDLWAVEQLRSAAREATARGAPESAAAYLRRARAEPPSADRDPDLLLELGLAEFSAGQPGWHDHLEGATEAADDDASRTAAALLVANGLGYYQRMAEAVEVCHRVAARLEEGNAEGHLMLEAMAVACGLIDATIAPSLGDRAAALVERARRHSVPRLAFAVAADVAALANQPADLAADLARRAIAAGPRPLPDPGDPPWFPTAAIALFYCERYGEAQALLDAAVAQARAAANGMILPAVLAIRAWLGYRRSDLTAAEADGRALLDATAYTSPLLFRLLAAGVLVDVLVERGDLDGAERALEPLAAELLGTSQTAAILRHARGRLRFAQHRWGEAFVDFRAAGEIATRTRAISPCYLPWRSLAARAALSCR